MIRERLADHDGVLPYAVDLGPRPDDPADARSWVTAATAITAYRERYDLPHHIQLLGERPGPLRPDAQAAYDHALHQHDHHLDRQQRLADPMALHALRPELVPQGFRNCSFDPSKLLEAHHRAVIALRTWANGARIQRNETAPELDRARLAVNRLERRLQLRAVADDRGRHGFSQLMSEERDVRIPRAP